MKRRDFLRQTGKAVAVAAVSGATGLAFHNRVTTTYIPAIVKLNDFRVPADPSFPAVTLANNVDPVTALNAALEAIGGIDRFVQPGERVTIKPNVGWDRAPEQAANTNPILVGEMVRQCLAAGAEEVIVTDVTCNDARRCFIRSGIREEAEKAGARVILAVDDDFVRTDLKGKLLTEWPVLKYFVQTDRLINMPIVKQHSLPDCTIGMKNLYGIIGGPRYQLHQQIDQSIVDLAAFCPPTLTVIDATRVLLRSGPQGGSLDDVARHDTVICATDQVAGDSRAAEFLGLEGANVSHFLLAEQSGLGTVDYRAAGYKEII
ncbi:MAG: DUF362 domain-containing protein [candidate division Zixibacteria bacterium]|nr:DUF362 domain-containing protein [candidate division Zixibacteria bacterium]